MNDKPALVKCLVWDLDNTLWQGTLLEDESVRLPGEIRDVIATLDSRGILQSLASKNDYDLAWQCLEDLKIADYFILPQIGWGRKSDSVIEVAEKLNFALSAVGFIADFSNQGGADNFPAPDVRR